MTTPVTPAAPTVTTDKTAYAPGDPITVTVDYTDPDNPGTVLTVTATVTNPDGSAATGTVDVQVGGGAASPFPVSVSDSFSGTWTQTTNEAGTAVFTSTVGTPPAAV